MRTGTCRYGAFCKHHHPIERARAFLRPKIRIHTPSEVAVGSFSAPGSPKDKDPIENQHSKALRRPQTMPSSGQNDLPDAPAGACTPLYTSSEDGSFTLPGRRNAPEDFDSDLEPLPESDKTVVKAEEDIFLTDPPSAATKLEPSTDKPKFITVKSIAPSQAAIASEPRPAVAITSDSRIQVLEGPGGRKYAQVECQGGTLDHWS